MPNDNLETGNFSIQNTMDMGMGNQSLIDDLFETGAATGNPDDVTDIISTTSDTTTEAPLVPKGKEIVQKTNPDDSLTGGEMIANFLGNDAEEEEEEEELSKPKPKNIQSATTGDEGDGEEGVETDNQFISLSTDLFKLGVFNKDESETDEDTIIDTPEKLLDRFNSEKKKGAIEVVNNFIGQFGEDYQNAFDAIFVKGVNPKDYFSTYNNVADFASLDLTKEDNQERVVKQVLADQGFEPDDIESEVERLKNYGDLGSVSERHHKILVKKEALKLQQMQEEASRNLQAKQIAKNTYVSSVQGIISDKLKDKTFDGIPLNPKLANELQDFLLVDKYKTPSGETLTDFDRTILDLKKPENHVNKVKIALLLKILEKDPTLSTIQKTGITQKSNNLFSSVTKRTVEQGQPKTTKSSNIWNL